MIGTILNQRFEITAEVGRGGTGTVYCARDVVLDRDGDLEVLIRATDPEGNPIELWEPAEMDRGIEERRS